MPTGWRLVKSKHAAQAFDGEGARLYGGRWNAPGTRMVYAAETAALAVLEMLVHLQKSSLLSSYVLFALHFEEASVVRLDRSRLPADWRAFPAPPELQRIGDAWARDRSSAVLAVPSAILPKESLYLLNPEHPGFDAIVIDPAEPFQLDRRLLG